MDEPHKQIKEKYFGAAWKPQTTSQGKTVFIKYLLNE